MAETLGVSYDCFWIGFGAIVGWLSIETLLGESAGVAEEMRASWTLEPLVVAGASPVDGPDGDPAWGDLLSNLSSSDDNTGCRLAASAAPPAPSPFRFGPGPGSGAAPQAARVQPPASGWDSRIEEVMRIEETGSASAPVDGWCREEQFRPTAAGRRIFSHPIFTDGLGSVPLHQTRSGSDIMIRALTLAGAKRVSSEEFRTLNDGGESVNVLKGRDIAV